MVSKRPKTAPKDPRNAAMDAALRLAGKRDWGNITLADVAKEAGLTLSVLSQMFECREDIICAYGRRVDADVLQSFEGSGSERDMLFDILMERFERLNRDRRAVLSILKASCTDPKQLVISLPHIARSMAWMCEACGIETQGWKGAARVAGLTGVYVWALRSWRDDESSDMGKTMATLDRALGRMEQCAGMCGL
jgi:AcrR family transcriptional regulator